MTTAAQPIPALTAEAPPGARAEMAALLRLAGPLVGANLLQMAIWASDVMFIARLGERPLAASTLAVYLYSVLLWAVQGLVGAVAPLVAAELGRRAHAVREVRRTVRMGLWLGLIGCVPLVTICLAGESVLLLLGQEPALAALAATYTVVIALAAVPTIFASVLRIAVAALGRPAWALIVTAAALPVNLVGNYMLVFGKWGAPELGLAGAAWASVATACVMLAAYVAICLADRRIRRFRLFGRWWRTEWRRFGEMVRLGVPIAAIYTLEGGVFGAGAFLMGLFGVPQVAAHALAMQAAAIAFQIPFGIGQAATIRVGMAYGAADAAWIARAGWCALALGTGVMLLTAVLFWAAPGLIVSAYLDLDDPDNARVVALALEFLVVVALFQLFDGCQTVAGGVLRGLQDTRVPMLLGAAGYWIVGFGTAVGLAFGAGLEGIGIWVGLAVGLATVSLLLMLRWAGRQRFGLLPRQSVA